MIEVGPDGLTETERAIYDRINACAEIGDSCPSTAQLAEPFGFTSWWAFHVVKRLQRCGKVRSDGYGKGRRLQIVASGKWTGIVGGGS